MSPQTRRHFLRNTVSLTTGLAAGLDSFADPAEAMIPYSKDLIYIDDEGVRANYDFIRNARIFILDAYTYPFTPDLDYNAEKMAEAMADMHADVLRIATSGHCGWLVPGSEFGTHKDLGIRDILLESIHACRKRGIKVIPYIATGHTINASIIKPEWAQRINPAGTIDSRWSMGVFVTPCCWNTPYRLAYFNFVKNVVRNYEIDGIYFDSWLPFYFFGGRQRICYCKGCTDGFRKATGLELPYRENDRYTPGELSTIENYRKWYKDQIFEVFTETKKIVRSQKDIPMIYNINNPTRIMNEDVRIFYGSDAFLYERGRSMIERAEGVSLANAHGITVWPYVGTYDPFPRIPHYKYELGQEIYTSAAFGGSPVLYHCYFFVTHPESREIVREAFGTLSENDRYMKGFRSSEFCAVTWNNTDPPGHDSRGSLWETSARLSSLGSFYACLNSHIQTTSLLKLDIDNIDLLSKYKVLYLPDICYLTQSQISAITVFVEKGGGLIMTYATSLYDENGRKNNDFSLGKLARIRYREPDKNFAEKLKRSRNFGSTWDVYLRTRPGQDVIKPPLCNGLIPGHLYETAECLPGGTVIADIIFGAGSEIITPGLIVSEYGKGRVAYISAAMGAMFMQTGIREYSVFLKNVIEYVSSEPVPYEIEAPASTLISNMTENKDIRVIHIINWQGSMSERMWQNIYHIPSIENVKIKFRIPAGKKVKSVRTFLPVELSNRREGNEEIITLGRVDKYQGVVIEMT